MAALQQVRPFTLFPDEVWKGLTARSSWRGIWLVAHAWGLIIAVSALVALWPNPLTWLVAVMVVGARQLGLAILMHEAAHGTLHPNTRVNVFLGEWLCAVPVGADLALYRPYHLRHHRFTQQDEDPDLSLSAPFPTTRASLRRKFIRDLTGQTFYKQRITPLLRSGAGGNMFVGETGRAQRRFFAATAIIFLLYAACGAWVWFFGVWLFAFATWFPLVTRIRNIAEHACTCRDPDPFTVARTTRANWLERLLIAPYFVHYHAEHHLFIAVPCYRLPRLHKWLRQHGHTGQMNIAPGYIAVLREVAT
jgi:fatty acid desaturase